MGQKKYYSFCFICKTTGNFHLPTHIQRHTNERPFFCKYCPVELKTKCSQIRHIACHEQVQSDGLIHCHLCKETVTTPELLEDHLKSHGAEIWYHGHERKCDDCEKSFKNRKSLSSHRRSVHVTDKYPCALCSMMFKTRGDRDRHTRGVHSDARPHQCETCGNKYKYKNDLNSHIKHQHSEVPPVGVKCQVCKRKYATDKYLRRHMLVHSDVKPFQCNFCPRAFVHFAYLTEHMVKHTEEKAFSCDICDKKFSSRQGKRYHLKTHQKRAVYMCTICGKELSRKETLRGHMRTHTPRKLDCLFCGRMFHGRYDLKTHLRTHLKEKPYFCRVCGKEFANPQYLRCHDINKHDGEEP